ncbi:hypothetical protein CVT24_001815 [Panaeolus cyanescens]|uniref:C2H2-type domain-containing protein n=1 Tax=Panaeolus cyanescens TaxID=181874 RepID=A0A409YFG7_9AGAR|nr:hypothetical protein CVT24_001815 [Panaeolus cyanescens]
MAKKKNKQIIRPWCWYCEREFEDEKVLMQHQKAKHFKCGMCPRRLNTAGGLAVHIQQVHKLEPENLPRIENALPGRDGYEVEIFGMEGIPAPDVADYKRRKEIELGLTAGSISQPPPKRAKIENRPLSEEELRRQLEEHKALMGLNNPDNAGTPAGESSTSTPSVFGAAQAYISPPIPATPTPPIGVPPPGFFPPGMPPPGAFPGAPPPFPPPFPGAFPPGPPPPGFMPPFPPGGPPPPGFVPPPGMPGVPPIPGRPPFMPPPFLPPGVPPPPGFTPPPGAIPGVPPMPAAAPPPTFVPASKPPAGPTPPVGSGPSPTTAAPPVQPKVTTQVRQPVLTLPNPSLAQTNPEFKKPTDLKVKDANFSPDEHRAIHAKYFVAQLTNPAAAESSSSNSASGPASSVGQPQAQATEETRGKKRARAEDFL